MAKIGFDSGVPEEKVPASPESIALDDWSAGVEIIAASMNRLGIKDVCLTIHQDGTFTWWNPEIEEKDDETTGKSG